MEDIVGAGGFIVEVTFNEGIVNKGAFSRSLPYIRTRIIPTKIKIALITTNIHAMVLNPSLKHNQFTMDTKMISIMSSINTIPKFKPSIEMLNIREIIHNNIAIFD
jgi:hypothetical protein